MKLIRKSILYLALAVLIMSAYPSMSNTSKSDLGNKPTTYDLGLTTSFLPADFQVFFDLLSPYGAWVEFGTYGYCWVPRLGVDFTPYSTNGHWVYTDEGWTWYSDYSWGWAPFHYGRWLYTDDYGWMWVPGHEWAPAWVVWGHYGAYYGWAPVGPGVTISIGYRPPLNYWTFVPEHRMADRNFHRYVIHDRRSIVHGNINIIFNSHSYRNVVYDRGPGVEDVERYSHRRYAPVSVKEFDHPLSNRESHYSNKEYRHNKPVPAYRPEIEHNKDFRGSPRKIDKIDNFKRSPGHDNGNLKGDRGGRDNGKSDKGGRSNGHKR